MLRSTAPAPATGSGAGPSTQRSGSLDRASPHPAPRRARDLQAALPATLHPVLRRVYGARRLPVPPSSNCASSACCRSVRSTVRTTPRNCWLRRLRTRRRVLVVGDFDADGATSTALMMRQLARARLRAAGFPGTGPVPVRLRADAGDRARRGRSAEPGLIVTVDNGVSSLDGRRGGATSRHRRAGHRPSPAGAALPDAACIVNPNARRRRLRVEVAGGRRRRVLRHGGADPRMRDRDALPAGVDTNPARLLDLVALGTVADVVPLDFNNRILVAQGLRRIRPGAARRPAGAARGRRAGRLPVVRARTSASRRDRDSTPPDGSRT